MKRFSSGMPMFSLYDPDKTTYEHLVEHSIRYGDPADATGSFYDRGEQYAPAVYCDMFEERMIADSVIRRIDAEGIYEKPITIRILSRTKLWTADEYHQDYAQKSSSCNAGGRYGKGI